jgi:hypothetical protein
MKISQDGNKLVTNYLNDTITEFCGFNVESGVVTPYFKFNTKYRHEVYGNIGNEFSLDSHFLYCNSGWLITGSRY